MTTDKQLCLTAIESLNKARDLLESSTDQAQHDIADEVGSLLMQLESLKFFGRSGKAPNREPDTDPENIYGLASIRQSIEEDRK